MRYSRPVRAAALGGIACLVAIVAGRPAVAQAPPDLPAGREVIDRFVEAVGGAGAVRKHRSQRSVGTFTIPSQGVSGVLEVLAAAPDRMVQRVTVPGIGLVASGFDGTVGWLVDPMMGPMVLEGKALEQLKADADFYAVLHGEDRYQRIETVERTAFEGRPAYKVRLLTRSGDEEFEFFDEESALLIGSMVTRTLPMGSFPTTTVIADYKTFGTLRLATTWRQRVMGVEQVLNITSVEFDTLDEAAFVLPPQIQALLK